PESGVLGGPGPLVALVNGYHSLDPCRVVAVGAPEAADLASHGALGLARAGRGLAIAFDPGEPGEARVHLGPEGLEAASQWLPTRPLRPEGDASRMRLAFDPQGDGLTALRALFVPSSPVDQERLAQAVAPAGWCSRQELSGGVSEADVVANTEFCAASFDRRFFRYIELDDGYQRAAGAWDTNDKFPHGHAWLTDQIHAKGFKAGLWLAPFAVAERSGVPAEHPEWLLRDASGPVVCDTRESWGGPIYVLGGAAQLLPALRLARRSRLPGGAAAAHTGGSSGVDVARRGDRRAHPLLGQPPEAPARASRPAAAHAARRPGSGPPDRRRRRGARGGAGDRRRQGRVPAQGPVALPYRRRRRVPCS